MKLIACVLVAFMGPGCSTTLTDSYDHAYNYENKFSEMPTPRPEVVNSHVERVTKTFAGKPWSTINGEWEFELVASRDWTNKLEEYFEPVEWEKVDDWLRRDLPPWFSPDREKYAPFQRPGPSLISSHLFVEKAPADPERIRLFICRH